MSLSKKSRGLGDTIEKITTVTGIKAAVDAVSSALGVDCGCSERKEALNRIFPYKGEQEKMVVEIGEEHTSVKKRYLPYRIKQS